MPCRSCLLCRPIDRVCTAIQGAVLWPQGGGDWGWPLLWFHLWQTLLLLPQFPSSKWSLRSMSSFWTFQPDTQILFLLPQMLSDMLGISCIFSFCFFFHRCCLNFIVFVFYYRCSPSALFLMSCLCGSDWHSVLWSHSLLLPHMNQFHKNGGWCWFWYCKSVEILKMIRSSKHSWKYTSFVSDFDNIFTSDSHCTFGSWFKLLCMVPRACKIR